MNFHTPILVDEVIKGLRIEKDGKYIDATVGGGGYAKEILKLGGVLLGIDADREAIEYSKKELKTSLGKTRDKLSSNLKTSKNWRIIQGNFKNIETIALENGFGEVNGVLFDLGVSSHQIDTPGRGFSYRFADARLDLRMNQSEGQTAADLINFLSEEDLYEIFARFGEEKLARPIARAVVLTRSLKLIRTVGDLVRIVEEVSGRRDKATMSRIFQSIRIAVNHELEALSEGLQGAYNVLRAGGRLAVLSYHSLEDRMVKLFLRNEPWNILTLKPIIAKTNEKMINPRSRSAKLRIAEKIKTL